MYPFNVMSGEYEINVEAQDHHDALVQALKIKPLTGDIKFGEFVKTAKVKPKGKHYDIHYTTIEQFFALAQEAA